MITGQTLITLTMAILIASIAAVEIRQLRVASLAYLIHSIFLCLIVIAYAFLSENESLYLWAGSSFLIKVVIIPWLLMRFIRQVPQIEYKPIIGFVFSIILLSFMMIILYRVFRGTITLMAPTPEAQQEPVRSLLAGASTIFSLGIWTLLSRRDVIKTVIGIALMENGVHLILLALAPQLKETTMIGILTNVVAAVFILLYLSTDIYRIFGTTDSARLSELKR
jgi:hydrogenase-4 component E